MIIGATGESDYTLLQTSQALYQGFDLKRVFYSAYIPLNDDSILPQIGTPPPLLREHRLYQADWLLRFYGFQADELLSESQPNFNEWRVSPWGFLPKYCRTTSMNCWIPNATGRCAIWNTFQWKLKKHLMPRCFGFPESGQNPPAGSLMPDDMAV